jgi:hypothetical protein
MQEGGITEETGEEMLSKIEKIREKYLEESRYAMPKIFKYKELKSK